MQQPPSPEPVRTDIERRALAGALAAELGHELQSVFNLLTLVRERLERGQAFETEEVLALGEETERLTRLGGRLRELSRWPLPQRGPTPARELVERALARLASAPELQLDLAADLQLEGEPTLLALALAELLTNALQARRTHAGVRAVVGRGICVWDDGAGFDLDQALGWGKSSKPEAAGLGLTLVLRAARASGLRLAQRHTGTLSEVWLLLPGGSMP